MLHFCQRFCGLTWLRKPQNPWIPSGHLQLATTCHSLNVSREKNQTSMQMVNKNGVPLKAVDTLMSKFMDYATVLVINASPVTQ